MDPAIALFLQVTPDAPNWSGKVSNEIGVIPAKGRAAGHQEPPETAPGIAPQVEQPSQPGPGGRPYALPPPGRPTNRPPKRRPHHVAQAGLFLLPFLTLTC